MSEVLADRRADLRARRDAARDGVPERVRDGVGEPHGRERVLAVVDRGVVRRRGGVERDDDDKIRVEPRLAVARARGARVLSKMFPYNNLSIKSN